MCTGSVGMVMHNAVDIVNNQANAIYNVSYGKKKSAILTKPIQVTQDTIESGVTTVVDKIETERKKKSHKRAIAVGSGVFVITALIALLNPRTSAKTLQKLKIKRENLRAKLKSTNTGTWKNKWYKFRDKALGVQEKGIEVCNDINNGKDILWKRLCCDEKQVYKKIKNKPIRNVLQGIDKGFIFIMKKPHELITKWFDTFTKNTVKLKYKSSLKETKKMNALIDTYKRKYGSKISTDDLKILEEKLRQITEAEQYLSAKSVEGRMLEQAKCMQGLEENVVQDFIEYGQKVGSKGLSLKERLKRTTAELHFFSEGRLQEHKTRLEQNGLIEINKLTGINETQKGLYGEVYDILSKHIQDNERIAIQNQRQKVYNALQKAHRTECIEYFDKKRDLVLGSAPTDVVSAVLGLGLAGLAVGKADTKDKKINRTIAVGGPAVIAVGTSLVLTSKLFTGFKNMALSTAIGFVVSKIGSFIANKITGQKDEVIKDGEPFLFAKAIE